MASPFVPTQAEVAAVRHALAALASLHCPRCRSRLEPLTVRQIVTAEDMLCDACRKWCYAVDDQNIHYRLIDIHGAAS